MQQSTVYGMAFALLRLLAKRFQPLDQNSKHQAWFNHVFPVVITLLAAGGVAVSSCNCVYPLCVYFASGNIANVPHLYELLSSA